MASGTLMASYPDPQSISGQTPAHEYVDWEIEEREYDDSYVLRTYVSEEGYGPFRTTFGEMTFTSSVQGDPTTTTHSWSSTPTYDFYTKRYVLTNTLSSTKTGYQIELPRKNSSYTVTVTIKLEVGARSTKQKFSDGSQIATTSVSFTIPALPTYTISYNANGGSNAPASQTKTHGVNLTLTSSVPLRDGYTFNSWNTSSNGSGTSYNPSSSFTRDSSTTLYAIWNPKVSFNGNGGSGIPSSFVKTFNAAATIPSNTPTRDGYTFVEWNTSSSGSGTSYQPSDTIPADYNVALVLYAIWGKITARPTISNITVIRCNSSGTASDMGTYAKITVVWSVDRTYDSSNSGLVTGRHKVSGSSSSTSFAFTSGHMGANGTATATLSGFDTDTQYEFIVEVQDSNTEAGHISVTERAVILTRAKFIMDLKAGGEAMGIFSAAPSSGLEIGKDTQIDGTLTVLKNITAPNLTLSTASGADVVTAQGNFSVSSAYAYSYGPVRMVCITFRTTDTLSAGTSYTMGTLGSAFSVPREIGFANQYGMGYVMGTSIYFMTVYNNLSSNRNLYVSITYIKP